MSTAIAKKAGSERFLRPLQSIEDLMEGRQYAMHNGQFIFKNDNGYSIADVSDDREYTVEDYLQLPEGAPFQLVQGKLIYQMASPKMLHQRVSMILAYLLFDFLKKHPIGEVVSAPMDVHLDIKNVFQPDLLFVSSERSHIIKDFVYGAPDLVVEILSPGSKKLDSKDKMVVYGKYHVREYWLIDPVAKSVQLFENHGDEMVEKAKLGIGGRLESQVLSGFQLEVGQLFS
jgi:Uma2 family endonuclease